MMSINSALLVPIALYDTSPIDHDDVCR